MKIPILAGLASYKSSFDKLWGNASKNELKWGDNRKLFLVGLAVAAILYVGNNALHASEASANNYAEQNKVLQIELTRKEIEIENLRKIVNEAEIIIAQQRHHITDLEKTILELKSTNKDLELEINSLERLLVAATDKHRQAEDRLEEHLRALQKVSNFDSSDREALQRRFNSLSK